MPNRHTRPTRSPPHLSGLILLLTLLVPACQKAPAFKPPSPKEFTDLLAFNQPVELIRTPVPPAELKDIATEFGATPLAGWDYANDEQTCEFYSLLLFKKGVKPPQTDTPPELAKSLKTPDGREIVPFLIGFGPGGTTFGAILPCLDGRHDLVLIITVERPDFGPIAIDENDPRLAKYNVGSNTLPQDLLPKLEKLLFP